MIIQTAPAGQPRLAIMMYEHTALSHQFARAFGNDRFQAPEPNDLMFNVVLHHDAGWFEFDRDPATDQATGLPYNLVETPAFTRALHDYFLWTGDIELLGEMYDFCKRGLLDYTLGLCDEDGDLCASGRSIIETLEMHAGFEVIDGRSTAAPRRRGGRPPRARSIAPRPAAVRLRRSASRPRRPRSRSARRAGRRRGRGRAPRGGG